MKPGFSWTPPVALRRTGAGLRRWYYPAAPALMLSVDAEKLQEPLGLTVPAPDRHPPTAWGSQEARGAHRRPTGRHRRRHGRSGASRQFNVAGLIQAHCAFDEVGGSRPTIQCQPATMILFSEPADLASEASLRQRHLFARSSAGWLGLFTHDPPSYRRPRAVSTPGAERFPVAVLIIAPICLDFALRLFGLKPANWDRPPAGQSGRRPGAANSS